MNAIVLNFLLAVLLFIFNSLLGKILYGYRGSLFDYGKFSFSSDFEENFAGNFFLRIVNPTIFMAVSCAIIQRFWNQEACVSLWLMVPLFWGVRLVYILVRNRISIINWTYELCAALGSLLLAEGVYFFLLLPLLDSDESIFISITELRDAVWYAIIAYIATVIWNIGKSLFDAQAIYPAEKRQRIIYHRYDKFSKKYGTQISNQVDRVYVSNQTGKENFICLVYAVMIYEDYNRPVFYRAAEYFFKAVFPKKEMTLGIMQVKTRKCISNNDSIDLAIEKLFAVFSENFDEDPIAYALRDYNGGEDYRPEVTAIYEELLSFLSINGLKESIETD